MNRKRFFEKIKKYHFEFKHLTVLFLILLIFQIIISFINKNSIKNFLEATQEWYQKDSAERLANLTTTSFELLLESITPEMIENDDVANKIIQSFDIIFSQQILQHNITEICILITKKGKVFAIDEGEILFEYLFNSKFTPPDTKTVHKNAISLYENIKSEISKTELIYSLIEEKQTFNTFVPFVLRGEYIGALYIKNTPDFSFITNEISSSYDETSAIYLSLILLGLLAMYFISSYTVKERDEAQKQLLKEHEENIKQQINFEKELTFTNRIYHTHHKAEKVMGFIKEDLRQLSPENINEVKERITHYSSFVSRVIYDMKWYDPPVQTIRSQLFSTDLNKVIKFIIDNIFLRTSSKSNAFNFQVELDEKLPKVPINEFVVWEIIEPLIQNSIEHGGDQALNIKIKTEFNSANNTSTITISDNGKGMAESLLENSSEGIKKIFLENITTKASDLKNSGYGCYIAYQMSRRCGWNIDAGNFDEGGCFFKIKYKN
ncbi:MAG: histidine kinase [Bacteroidetes bacterium]|nr:histidine kinase [Bacteroidota bacterium]